MRRSMPTTMLCACSGEQFELEEIPQSPESLATRDFSASGISSRTNDCDSKFDDSDHIDDVESALKEALSLNYEEARALLGRLEYQKGNYDAALHVFQGIDIQSLAPKMAAAIEERTRQKRGRSKGETSAAAPAMSMHSVSLLLEATLLKAKSLKELGRPREAAEECVTIVDVVETALPSGLPRGSFDDCKMQEMLHKALDLLPRLWKQAESFENAISSYRRAVSRSWNLDSQSLASIQKDLATLLLYGGLDVPLPSELQQVGVTSNPRSSIEEAVLLLMILMRKMVLGEIPRDSEIMNHLCFALSMTNRFDILADHIEQLLPGVSSREERWYLLALCYFSMGKFDPAINLLEKGHSHFHSLLLGSKLCSQRQKHAVEGIAFAQNAMRSPEHNIADHFKDSLHHFLGISYGHCSRSSSSDSERLRFEEECLKSLGNALTTSRFEEPEIFFSIGLENLAQRNLKVALKYAKKHMEMVGGASLKGWKLLAAIMSATQSFSDAEAIIDVGLSECGERDYLYLLRLKAVLQAAQEQYGLAIGTYKVLLTAIQSQNHERITNPNYEDLAMQAWQDLILIYAKIGYLDDANTCLENAKSIRLYSGKTWQLAGQLIETKCLYKESMGAYFASLSIEPECVSGMVSTAELLMKYGSRSLPVARSFLMNALQFDPRNHDAWLNLGLVSKKQGLLQQAADCFQAAVELSQSTPLEVLSDEIEYLTLQ